MLETEKQLTLPSYHIDLNFMGILKNNRFWKLSPNPLPGNSKDEEKSFFYFALPNYDMHFFYCKRFFLPSCFKIVTSHYLICVCVCVCGRPCTLLVIEELTKNQNMLQCEFHISITFSKVIISRYLQFFKKGT